MAKSVTWSFRVGVDLLERQVVRGTWFVSGLIDGDLLFALNGQTLRVSHEGDCIGINGACIVVRDITLSNGVLHVVDKLFSWMYRYESNSEQKSEIYQKNSAKPTAFTPFRYEYKIISQTSFAMATKRPRMLNFPNWETVWKNNNGFRDGYRRQVYYGGSLSQFFTSISQALFWQRANQARKVRTAS